MPGLLSGDTLWGWSAFILVIIRGYEQRLTLMPLASGQRPALLLAGALKQALQSFGFSCGSVKGREQEILIPRLGLIAPFSSMSVLARNKDESKAKEIRSCHDNSAPGDKSTLAINKKNSMMGRGLQAGPNHVIGYR